MRIIAGPVEEVEEELSEVVKEPLETEPMMEKCRGRCRAAMPDNNKCRMTLLFLFNLEFDRPTRQVLIFLKDQEFF